MGMRRVKVLDEEGWFHCFVVCEDHVWAMVEFDDGRVSTANADAMRFLDTPKPKPEAKKSCYNCANYECNYQKCNTCEDRNLWVSADE
jgi:hypothetical protein